MSVIKYNGDIFGARISFSYKGSSRYLRVGLNVDVSPSPLIAYTGMQAPASLGSWSFLECVVDNWTWWTNLGGGRGVDVDIWVQDWYDMAMPTGMSGYDYLAKRTMPRWVYVTG